MIRIVGYFRDRVVSREFDNALDAMEFRDTLDAQYAKVKWIEL